MTKIFVLTHKAFVPPPDPIYVPLSVHEASGDNIAEKNEYYSELTGLYWIWKNCRDDDCDIVGTAHYRRYLLDGDGGLLTEKKIRELLSRHDCITTKTLDLNFSYLYGFGENHKPYYLEELSKLLAERFPEDSALFERLVRENHTYFGNMMICRKGFYDEYMEWLFDILFQLEERIVIEEEDSYHRRIFGFISEFLWFVWVKKRKLDVFETMVGMTCEKAETAEIKKKLADYFARGDYQGAGKFFLEAKKKRPDILMEASDITGELHLCMEVICICKYEAAAGKPTILDMYPDYKGLMKACRSLNDKVRRGEIAEGFSDEACFVAEKMFNEN